MRIIESKMLQALRAGKAWRSGNTRVTAREKLLVGYRARVTLHGHPIADLHFTDAGGPCPVFYMQVSLAGYNTRTTRSRLTALVSGFMRVGRWPEGCGVSTRAGQAYLHDATGKHPMPDNEWVTVTLGE